MAHPEFMLHVVKLEDGKPCHHPWCLQHVTHPCEGCGRINGKTTMVNRAKDLIDNIIKCKNNNMNQSGICSQCESVADLFLMDLATLENKRINHE
jgi:hypothetical protein